MRRKMEDGLHVLREVLLEMPQKNNSDYLVAKGHEVTHIIDDGKTRRHKLTRFAKIIDGILIYPERNCV